MLPQLRGSAITIGNFDGVHLGHQTVLQTLRRLAKNHGNIPTMAVSFEPHPQKLLNPQQAPERLTGVRSKARWMGESGVDALFILRFSKQLATWTPEQFVRLILVEGLAVKSVLVGHNFRFGAKGAGNLDSLKHFGETFGFDVHFQPLLQDSGNSISSTRIRHLIKTCQFTQANQLLGHPFEIESRVIPGFQRGRGLGFPTANLALAGILHPPTGIYIVEGHVDGKWLPAVANLGYNPTFGHEKLHLEVHLMAECGDIYRKLLRVRFLKRLRSEIKFPNVEALKKQIAQDVQDAQAFFKQRHDDTPRSLN